MREAAAKDPKIEKMGSNLMSGLPDGTRAFLFMRMSDKLPFQEFWRSGEKAKGIGGDGKRVRGICAKRQRSVLIHNSEKDTQMRGIKARSFSSALCVPVFDETRSLIGCVLLTSDQPDSFTNDHKFSVERSARDFSPTLVAMRRLFDEARVTKMDQVVPSLPRVSLALTGFAALLLVIWLAAPSAKEPIPEKTVVPPSVSQEAKKRAELYLTSLREEKYEEAWALLSPSLRSRWPVSEFSRAVSDWRSNGDNDSILEQRRIHRVEQHDQRSRVVLLDSGVTGDTGDWVWALQKDGGDWDFTKLEGPVDSPED